LRRLGGWEPRVETVFEYDNAGRVVRSVTSAEPEWRTEDVDILLASRYDELSRGSHGVPMSEATDPANQFAYVSTLRTDWAARSQADAIAAARRAADKDASFAGVFAVVQRRDEL